MSLASRRSRAALGWAAVAGVVVVPLVFWLAVPGLAGHLESRDGFVWVGAEPGTGQPLLLREQFDGREILAGSERFGISGDEPVACFDGPVELLRAAAKQRGRIEDLRLRSGLFRVLSVTLDDLGGPTTTYVYRCSAGGAQPLLSWGRLPGFGLRAFGIAWLVWTAAWALGLAILRRARPARVAHDPLR
jgi:hypothetical protein